MWNSSRSSQRLVRFGIASLVFGLLTPGTIEAGLWGNPELLERTAKQHVDNRNRLKTWQGKATVEMRFLDGRILQSKVDFVHDAKARHFRWNWEVEKATPADSWKHQFPGKRLNGMLKEGWFYEYKTHTRTDGHGNFRPFGNLVIADPKKNRIHQLLAGYFEPMWHWNPQSIALQERLRFVRDNADHPKNHWEVSKKGELVIFRHDGDNTNQEINDGDHIVNHYEIDLSKGANLTLAHYYSPKSNSTTDYRISWENVNDVWVPKEFTYHRLKRQDGKKIYESIREVRWSENIVNEPLPKDAFTNDAVGLGPGDWVTDHSTKPIRHYRVPELTLEPDPNPAQPKVCPIPKSKPQTKPAVAEKSGR